MGSPPRYKSLNEPQKLVKYHPCDRNPAVDRLEDSGLGFGALTTSSNTIQSCCKASGFNGRQLGCAQGVRTFHK